MHYRCFICHRPSKGFGWHDPNRHQTIIHRRTSLKRFCSKDCQDIDYQLYRNKGKGEVDVNKAELEQKAAESVLGPLADYVVQVGLDKGLGAYSKAEIFGLVNTVLESYHRSLQQLYKDEIPF